MKKHYKVLLMDLDNTLFDFEHSEKTALISTAKHFDLQDDSERFERTYHEINKPLWEALERGEIGSDTIKRERFLRLIDRLNIAVDPDEMSHYYIQRLGEGIKMFPFAKEICETLFKDYRLVAITNGIKAVQEQRMARSGMLSYFEALIISEEAGVSKPDPRIFEMALERIGHSDKNTVLMIGDSMKADILGAQAAGIESCWVNLKGTESPEFPVYRWEVKKLEQLLNYL